MKRTDEMKGRRLPDHDFKGATNIPHMEPGDFIKMLNHPGEPPTSNLTGETWYGMSPNGLLANLDAHTVRELVDGSISVEPGDGSTNSILVRHGDSKSWHGYITRGLWWSLA